MAKPNPSVSVFFALWIVMSVSAHSAFGAESEVSTKTLRRLQKIEAELSEIEKSQKETLAAQDGIIKAVQELKIRVHMRT